MLAIRVPEYFTKGKPGLFSGFNEYVTKILSHQTSAERIAIFKASGLQIGDILIGFSAGIACRLLPSHFENAHLVLDYDYAIRPDPLMRIEFKEPEKEKSAVEQLEAQLKQCSPHIEELIRRTLAAAVELAKK